MEKQQLCAKKQQQMRAKNVLCHKMLAIRFLVRHTRRALPHDFFSFFFFVHFVAHFFAVYFQLFQVNPVADSRTQKLN